MRVDGVVDRKDLRFTSYRHRQPADFAVGEQPPALVGVKLDHPGFDVTDHSHDDARTLGWSRGPTSFPGPSAATAGTLDRTGRSDEHTSELQVLMRRSYAVFCFKKKNIIE